MDQLRASAGYASRFPAIQAREPEPEPKPRRLARLRERLALMIAPWVADGDEDVW